MSDSPDSFPGVGRPAVLIVDDESALIEPIVMAMESCYQVESANSVEEAEMRLGLERFDLIISDHLMPGEMGLDFLTRMRERYPAMKRILMTGYINPELISRSMQVAGLSACILKPMTPREVLAEVQRALSA